MATSATSWRGHAGALLGLGLPLVGSSLAGFLIHMTDTVMLGWYDVTALAAATIATQFWFVLFIVGAGFAHAVMPMVAAAAAEGDEVRARRVTRMALWLSAAFAALTLPVLWFSRDIFLALGQTEAVATEGQRYLLIAAFGMLPALGQQVLRSFLSALGLTAVQLWITLAGLVGNALVNYALIFGNWGAPELGIRGAAIASVLLQIATLAAIGLYAAVKLRRFTLFQRLWRPDVGALGEVFRLGLPIGLTAFAESGLFAGSSIMMGWIGESELAAHGIALQLAAVTFMFHVGMSQAATVLAGRAYGRRDESDLRRIGRIAFAIAGGFGIAVVTLFLLLPEPLVGLFLDPDEPRRDVIVAIGASLVMAAALFQFADAAQIMALSLLRGVQDTQVPMWLATVSYWIVGLPAGYLLAFPLGIGPIGLWLGLTVGLGAAALSLSWRFWGRSVRIGPGGTAPA